MKKKLINYYELIILFLFIIYNYGLKNFKIEGLLYVLFMIILIIFNTNTILKYSKDIKYKKILTIISFITTILLARNGLQYIFGIINVLTLIIVCFKEKILGKVVSIITTIVIIVLGLPLLLNYLFRFGTTLSIDSDRYDIAKDTHYYCKNNHEIYAHSRGASSSYKYSNGKYYEYINIDNLIKIYYSERTNISQKDYNNYQISNKCYY